MKKTARLSAVRFSAFSCIVIFFAVFSVLLLRALIMLDPDFGWHLSTGRLILAKGIPHSDPFSYTMPSYHFIDYEWLSNVIIAFAYPLIGVPGLAAVAAGIVTASLLIVLAAKLNKFSAVLLILGASTLSSWVGIRPQIVSWLLFAILLLLTKTGTWNKYRIFVPFILLVWANLHGGFILGIGIVYLWVFVRILRKDSDRNDYLVLFFSSAAVLVNPYGFSLVVEVQKIISDGFLRFSVAEWIPTIFTGNLGMWPLVALSATGILRYWTSFSSMDRALFIALLFIGLSSSRNAPFFILFSLPVIERSFRKFELESSFFPDGPARFGKAYQILAYIVLLFAAVELTFSFRQAFSISEAAFYPENAIHYLKFHPFDGHLFSDYDWGGYLIWRLPEEKVFVDGRMPVWQIQHPPPHESGYAFKEYLNLVDGKQDFIKAGQKYRITVVMLPIRYEKGKLNGIISRIKRAGWKKVFADHIAVIYYKRS